MGIKHWPEGERPREKLLQRGPAALSDAELLAIFLRTGIQGRSAVDLARDLIEHFGGLRGILCAPAKSFMAQAGLGPAKYCLLQAVLEMAQRHLADSLREGDLLNSPQAVQGYLRARLRAHPYEVFYVLLLDTRHRLIHDEALFRGTIDGASVYPREVVRLVIEHNAAAVILAHNHPSGVAEPSQADRAITERLRQALGLIDVRVLDHIIVGENRCASFAERGLL
jgi:DNA repair protein RadC